MGPHAYWHIFRKSAKEDVTTNASQDPYFITLASKFGMEWLIIIDYYRQINWDWDSTHKYIYVHINIFMCTGNEKYAFDLTNCLEHYL